MALVAAVRVNAAVVTQANDVLSTLQASQPANHELLFTTPSGVSEGNAFTVTFDSGFNTTSIDEQDVDVADNGTELTTAASCVGTEKAAVSRLASVITVMICPGDGGAIAAGHAVRVRIGTNAVNSGVGSHRIINPSSFGTHFVAIGGSFGDVGTILLPILSISDAVSVTANIPAPAGGGGGDGGCKVNCEQNQADSTPPVISSIVVSGITNSSATISWSTDEDANSRVNYGITDSFELGFVLDASLSKTHSMTLSGLQEGKTYFFQIKSADQSNNIATAATQTLNTLDKTAPVVSNIQVVNITKSGATITWDTNEASTSELNYGLTAGYGFEKIDATLTTSHTFVLSGLQSGTTYYFRVKSQDASANLATSSGQTFVTLSDLPPANVSALSAVSGDQTVVLTWQNPTDEDFVGVRVLRCLNAYPTGPQDATCTVVLNRSLSQSLTQNGLTNKTTYYYGVFSEDAASQFASGALVLGQPSAPEKEVPKEVCGDLICSATETQASCPLDCGVPAIPPVCGDNQCVAPESAISCPVDCAVQTPILPGSACGNDVCDELESPFTCPSDCKVEVVKPPSGSEVGYLNFSDVELSVMAGSISLQTRDGYPDVLPGSRMHIRVPAAPLGKGVDRVTLVIGSNSFILRPVTSAKVALSQTGVVTYTIASTDASVLSYEADVSAPNSLSLNAVAILVEYTNGQSITASSFLRVVAPGSTREIIDGEEAPIAGTSVKLFSVVGGESVVWDGSPYGQSNPMTSSSVGSFAWYVPNGRYYVHAEQDNYQAVDTPVFDVSNHIVNPRILMSPLVLPEVIPVKTATEAVLSSVVGTEVAKTIATTVSKTVQNIVESKPVQVVTKSLEVVREIPAVQTAADVSVPTLVVSAGTSVVVMSVAFDFLPFVQYLFTAPVLFFGRRKRKSFGVVYNAVSKEPIGLAVVRLYKLAEETEKPGKLVASRVTDKGGRFYFLVQPGMYRMSVTKVGFQYPSDHLKLKKEDAQYIDLYHGELLRVSEADAVITPNIPLDPSQAAQFTEPKSILWRARLRTIQHIIALSGVIASIVFVIIRPNMLAAAMVFVQIGVYLLVQRLAKPRKPKSWGIVYDKNTGRPLANVVARIFEPKYNKLLETQVTDAHGRYSFLLGPAEYFAVFEKEGYRSTQVRPIDYSKDKEAKDFSLDIQLFSK